MYRKQILAQLKLKNAGVSDKVLGLIADKLVAKVTTEEEIEGVVDELENLPISIKDYAELLQKEGDRRVTEAAKKKPTIEEDDGPNPKPANIPDDAPEYVKQLLGVVKTLGDQVNVLVKEKQTGSIKSKLSELIGKDVPETFYKRIALPESEDEITALADEIKADWSSLQQDQKNKGLGNLRQPVGGGEQEGPAPKVSEAIKQFAEKQVQAAKKETV